MKSIVFKLFLITTVFFVGFISIALVVQTYFFESFYSHQKTKNLENNLEVFRRAYERSEWDDAELKQRIRSFSDQHNVQLAVLDQNGHIKQMNTAEITVKTVEKRTITVDLSNEVYTGLLEEVDLVTGANIELKGIYLNESDRLISPFEMTINGKKWQATGSFTVLEVETSPGDAPKSTSDSPVNDVDIVHSEESIVTGGRESHTVTEKVGDALQRFSGVITHVNVPTNPDLLYPYRMNVFYEAVQQWFWSQTRERLPSTTEPTDYDFVDRSSGITHKVMVEPITQGGKSGDMLFALVSYQPVGEAMEVMKHFYKYVFVGVLIFILILSLLYSKMVARPLVKMNEVAGRMAALDFTKKCDVRSNDELGSLAHSLNALSDNLRSALQQSYATNEQLQQEIEKERKMEQFRKEFVANVSHELKTPLGIIKGFGEGLRDGVSAQKHAHYVQVILDEVDKMDQMATEMVELARLEATGYALHKVYFDLRSAIDRVLDKFRQQLEEKELNVQLHLADRATVFADQKKIEQVLTNLLSNALRFTREKGAVTMQLSEQDGRAHVSIANEGERLTEDHLARIWERFYRTDSSRTRQTGGTGLGLSIVKTILDLHGSKYGVKNTETGVCFYFFLNICSDRDEN